MIKVLLKRIDLAMGKKLEERMGIMKIFKVKTDLKILSITLATILFFPVVVCNNGDNVIVKQEEHFTITFTQITDAAPNIVGPTIYIVASEGRPTTATLTVENPDQYDTDSIKWYVNDSVTEGDSIVLDSGVYNRLGDFFLTVVIEKDGIPYNKTITFTVEQ